MLNNIDLNIDNYELKDILNLFGITSKITINELKTAKKIVYKTHPDKSNLDKKYFLFFSSAYKILYNISLYREKNNIKRDDCEILTEIEKIKLDNILNDKHVKKDFNKWFNVLFEKSKIQDDFTKSGYGDWLKSNEDLEYLENLNKNDLEKKLENKKNQIKKFDQSNIDNCYNNNYIQNNILRETPTCYSSEIFSKLNFEDLKKAHIESVIPVTKEDLNNIKTISLEELNNTRNEKILPSSLSQAKEFLNNKNQDDNHIGTERAYKLLREDEKIKKQNKIWWTNFNLIH